MEQPSGISRHAARRVWLSLSMWKKKRQQWFLWVSIIWQTRDQRLSRTHTARFILLWYLESVPRLSHSLIIISRQETRIKVLWESKLWVYMHQTIRWGWTLLPMSYTTHKNLLLPLNRWSTSDSRNWQLDATLLLLSRVIRVITKKTRSCSIKALSIEVSSDQCFIEPTTT